MFESQINAKHLALLASGSNIGNPIGSYVSLSSGGFRNYDNGSIYVSNHTQAHMITGYIRDRWRELGAENSPLGYPITDEIDASGMGGNRRIDFQNGVIIWKNFATHAFAVIGEIFTKWRDQNYGFGPLGYPVSDEILADGIDRQMKFVGGTIWSINGFGANIVLNNQVSVTNNTPVDITVRFYDILDPIDFVTSVPFANGTIVIPAHNSINWNLPIKRRRMVQTVKVTLDRDSTTNFLKTVSKSGHITYSLDPRVHIRNISNVAGTLRFYNPALLIQVLTLPNGEQPIAAQGEIFWRIPEDLTSVKVNFNNVGDTTLFRGESFSFNIDDKIHIHNTTNSDVRFLFVKQGDKIRLGALPGGDITIPGNSEATFTVPIDIQNVWVVCNVRPTFLLDNRALITPIDAVRGSVINF